MNVTKTKEGFLNNGSTGKLVRITGSSFIKTGAITEGHPIEFRHWQDVVDEADRELEFAAGQDDEESVVELWLEDPQSFQNAFNLEGSSPAKTAGSMIRHADGFGRKQAVTRQTNWDQEFADAQSHAQSILSKLGNAR